MVFSGIGLSKTERKRAGFDCGIVELTIGISNKLLPGRAACKEEKSRIPQVTFSQVGAVAWAPIAASCSALHGWFEMLVFSAG
jgi:hypothetical protein